ncbi:MAG: LPS export ABC transporter permease LptF [Geobacter sp.]|nr:LPS export ABC transporter permease LptF [Geobacter sp.]
MPLTLYRYLAKELLVPFMLGTVIFTGVLLMGRMLKIADMVVSKGISLSEVFLLILYLMPNFAVITLPMALLMAVLVAFSRLSADSEIIAVKASGISLYRLLPPVIAVAFAAYLLTVINAAWLMPKGNVAFKSLLYQAIQQRLSLNLKEQVFNSSIPGLLIYIDRNDEKSGQLSGVLIQDERKPDNISTIFARQGTLGVEQEEKKLHLRLSDGSIHQSRPNNSYRNLEFKDYELTIDLANNASTFEKNELDMSLAEIKAKLRAGGLSKKITTEMQLEIQRRFALPFACFIFAIFAVPLGIHNRRSGKAAGFTLSILTLLFYYILQSFSKTLAEKALLAPAAAAWLPNGVFLCIGVYLFIKAAREEQIWLFDRGAMLIMALFRKRSAA